MNACVPLLVLGLEGGRGEPVSVRRVYRREPPPR